MTAYRGKLQFS